MLRPAIVGSALMVILAVPGPAAAQTLKLEIRDGQVTLDARGVSVRQIMEEWARVGQVAVVNADTLDSSLTTIVLETMPERQAIDTLLRGSAGYILGERAPQGTVDRIFIVRRTGTERTLSSRNSALTPVSTATPRTGENATPNLLIIGGRGSADNSDATAAQPGLVRDSGVAVMSVGTAASLAVETATEQSSGDRSTGDLPARPTPVRYLDSYDENGNRLRAPTVPPDIPGAATGDSTPSPANPFGVTSGAVTPGPAPTP